MAGGGSSNLVESWEDVVGKLNLSDGRGAGNGGADAKSHDALLAKGSVEDSVLPCGQKIRGAGSEREPVRTRCHTSPCVFIGGLVLAAHGNAAPRVRRDKSATCTCSDASSTASAELSMSARGCNA